MSEDKTPSTIEYRLPKSTAKPGWAECAIGFGAAMIAGVVCYRFGWELLVGLYDIAKRLPCFGPDIVGTWSFAVLNTVFIAGPVALIGVVMTVVVSRIRDRRRD